MVLCAYLAITWPQIFLPLLGLLWVVSYVLDVRRKQRVLKLIGEQYGRITPSESATFVGLYRPHWEVGHIQIARSKRCFGLIPVFESWAPRFIAKFPVDFDLLDNDFNYLIRFRGTPSERGQYGHKGAMGRIIEITEFFDVKPILKNVG